MRRSWHLISKENPSHDVHHGNEANPHNRQRPFIEIESYDSNGYKVGSACDQEDVRNDVIVVGTDVTSLIITDSNPKCQTGKDLLVAAAYNHCIADIEPSRAIFVFVSSISLVNDQIVPRY